jgi:hypothetical protein
LVHISNIADQEGVFLCTVLRRWWVQVWFEPAASEQITAAADSSA